MGVEVRVTEATSVAEAARGGARGRAREGVAAGEIAAPQARPEIIVEKPSDRSHGDLATNLALRLAKAAGLPPRRSRSWWSRTSTPAA